MQPQSRFLRDYFWTRVRRIRIYSFLGSGTTHIIHTVCEAPPILRFDNTFYIFQTSHAAHSISLGKIRRCRFLFYCTVLSGTELIIWYPVISSSPRFRFTGYRTVIETACLESWRGICTLTSWSRCRLQFNLQLGPCRNRNMRYRRAWKSRPSNIHAHLGEHNTSVYLKHITSVRPPIFLLSMFAGELNSRACGDSHQSHLTKFLSISSGPGKALRYSTYWRAWWASKMEGMRCQLPFVLSRAKQRLRSPLPYISSLYRYLFVTILSLLLSLLNGVVAEFWSHSPATVAALTAPIPMYLSHDSQLPPKNLGGLGHRILLHQATSLLVFSRARDKQWIRCSVINEEAVVWPFSVEYFRWQDRNIQLSWWDIRLRSVVLPTR